MSKESGKMVAKLGIVYIFYLLAGKCVCYSFSRASVLMFFKNLLFFYKAHFKFACYFNCILYIFFLPSKRKTGEGNILTKPKPFTHTDASTYIRNRNRKRTKQKEQYQTALLALFRILFRINTKFYLASTTHQPNNRQLCRNEY